MSRTASIKRRQRAPDLHRVVRSLMRHVQNPARIIELYYWSREPDLCKILLAVAAIRPSERETLGAFFKLASNREKIAAQPDSSGALRLVSPEAAETLELMRHASLTEHPSDDPRTRH